MNSLKCLVCAVVGFTFFGLYFLLPIAGLVYVFFYSSPTDFLKIALGISAAWLSLGAGLYLSTHSCCWKSNTCGEKTTKKAKK